VAILAAAAIVSTPPSIIPPPAAAVLATAGRAADSAPQWSERVDTMAKGESLTGLLERVGLRGPIALQFLREATGIDHRRLPAGMPITVRALGADSLPAEVVLHLAVDRLLHVQRTDSGWVSREERLPWTTDTVAYAGVIHSTLYAAFDSAAASLPASARSELAWSVADIFEYRVDMSRDLQDGDAFRVLAERARGPNGIVRMGRVLAATFTLSGTRLDAIELEQQGRTRYYDQDGTSLQAGFLRAPLAFRRISSVFGMRKHPILGVWRAHKGTDYAASSGTPVRAIGDGVVIYAGRRSGYGNVVEIRHRSGFVSRYGHLRGYAKGTRGGARVTIGQTIAFVGMTGLATAPHLHFEVLVNGVQRNPRTALANKGGEPLAASERPAFDARRTDLLARLDQLQGSERLAAAGRD
jgi:murein DD-endopeptidase MepM/ murein hydrolase activator NlpD